MPHASSLNTLRSILLPEGFDDFEIAAAEEATRAVTQAINRNSQHHQSVQNPATLNQAQQQRNNTHNPYSQNHNVPSNTLVLSANNNPNEHDTSAVVDDEEEEDDDDEDGGRTTSNASVSRLGGSVSGGGVPGTLFRPLLSIINSLENPQEEKVEFVGSLVERDPRFLNQLLEEVDARRVNEISTIVSWFHMYKKNAKE